MDSTTKPQWRQVHCTSTSEKNSQTVKVDGTYPVDIYSGMLDYLRSAQHNEYTRRLSL